MRPVVITAAICGAELTREQTPYLPITPAELAEEAARCREAGASVIHLHVRRPDGAPTQDRAIFQDAIDRIRAACDVIVQVSTGGAVGMSFEERAQPLLCKPDMATLNCGSMNFGDEIFENSFPVMREMGRRIQEKKIVPELEIYDAGMIDNAMILVKEGLVAMPAQLDFVLGVRGGLSASAENLAFLITRLPHPACTWSAAGIGRWQLPLAQLAIARGGNVRVGIEDNIFLSKGVLAKGSHELVAAAVKLVQAAGERVANPAEAREILLWKSQR